MGRPHWPPGRTSLAAALTPPLLAADHSERTLFLAGGGLVVLAVVAIALGVWGGRRRK